MRRPTWQMIWSFVLSRSVVLVGMFVAVAESNRALATAFTRWDAGILLRLAREGYPDGVFHRHVAFFPGFPLSVRLFGSITHLNYRWSAMIINVAASLLVMVEIRAIGRRFLNDQIGQRAAIFLILFPGTFVFFMTYSDALFLALLLGSVLCFLDKRWLWCAVLAFVASLTRQVGMLLVIPYAMATFRDRHRIPKKYWIVSLAPAGGAIAYFLYLYWRHGQFFEWFIVQNRYWNQGVDPIGLLRALREAASHPLASVNLTSILLSCLVALALLWFTIRSDLPIEWRVFAIIVLLQLFTSQALGARLRMQTVAFPAFIAMAAQVRGRWAYLYGGGALVGLYLCAYWAVLPDLYVP